MTDIVLLTEDRYELPSYSNDYVNNILLEAKLLKDELEALGLKVERKSWSNSNYDWSTTKAVVFRTTWDYFDRFKEFRSWIEKVKDNVMLINSWDIIEWNMDKHYLDDLAQNGIDVTPTLFIEKGDDLSLKMAFKKLGHEEAILKPVISGAARHTYRINRVNLDELEGQFAALINEESMMIQPFMKNILSFGEISLMLFDGKYSHAIIKKAKPGDFRVQDDFGGTVEHYKASEEEIQFAENVFKACKYQPVYGRVDMTYDNDDKLVVMELELVEPELWFRYNKNSAALMARALANKINSV